MTELLIFWEDNDSNTKEAGQRELRLILHGIEIAYTNVEVIIFVVYRFSKTDADMLFWK